MSAKSTEKNDWRLQKRDQTGLTANQDEEAPRNKGKVMEGNLTGKKQGDRTG